MISLQRYADLLPSIKPYRYNGQVTRIIGLMVESQGPLAKMGDVCHIIPQSQQPPVLAEVVGFRDDRVLLMPLGELGAVGPGCEVLSTGDSFKVPVGLELQGRVLDGLGRPLDGGEGLAHLTLFPTQGEWLNPLKRNRINEPLGIGVRAIDGLLTVGKGQRVGIFAGSGVGKSTLLGMIARQSEADINVIALIGERGREVREFIEKSLGTDGLMRSVVIVATSDQPALVRMRGAMVATAVAEYFRDLGKDVLLMMDSVTRYAYALREVGLAVGEPPATRGYPPSVFSELPRLMERAGPAEKGSITAFYTVLVDGDDLMEPVADSVRGILDGHIVLNRLLANRGHYPAIDILQSVSRLAGEVTSEEQQQVVHLFRDLLAVYTENEDLISVGAYQRGANPVLDKAIRAKPEMDKFLQQSSLENPAYADTLNHLQQLKEVM